MVRSRFPSALAAAARMGRLLAGLALCAIALWLTVRVDLGLSPWDVLHSGIAARTGMPFGTVLIVVGGIVLVVAALLGERPGIGTPINIVLVGLTINQLIETPWLTGLTSAATLPRMLVLVGAVALLGLGGAIYLSARLGAGPRDSLMVACCARGLPVTLARTGIELSVLAGGWLLGGRVGIGTVVLALGSGPAVALGFRLIGSSPVDNATPVDDEHADEDSASCGPALAA